MSVRRDVVNDTVERIDNAINFDYGIEWFDEFTGAWGMLADIVNEVELNKIISRVIAKLAPKLRSALRDGKIDKSEAYKIIDFFNDPIADNPTRSNKQIIDKLYEYVDNYGSDSSVAEDIVAEETTSINTMSDIDQAKTSESVTATPTPAKPKKRASKSSSPKRPPPLDELAKALKLAQSNIKAEQRTSAKDRAQYVKMMSMMRRQGNPTIDGKQLNFEVMEEPRKTSITFNKDNTIATIRPTFKAKITI